MQAHHNRSARIRFLRLLLVLLLGLSPVASAVHAQATAQDITCEDGNGEYSTRFATGVGINVGPERSGAFAERTCAAKLFWSGPEIAVASDAGQVGIDVLGADLGFGKPVVAFQIDKSGSGSRRTYEIYSLFKPPRPLYTLSGGSFYSAADTDLDGRVEIWTDDAAAMDGFERIPGSDFDLAPTVVLRFEKGRPLDVGFEFLSFYDTEIAKLRSQISEPDLAEFKQSDGALNVNSAQSSEKLHRLMRTKMRVLEMVWAYLYSAREHEAWSALEQMWPPGDAERIRAAISALHQSGILRNIARDMHTRRRGHVRIEDAIDTAVVANSLNPFGGAPDTSQIEPSLTQPKSILLRRPPEPPDAAQPPPNEMVELVVDVAGKVRSAKIVNGKDQLLLDASAGWQFIPAFRAGRPVACRFRLSVWSFK